MTIPHGRASGYDYHKCRCDECRAYNRDRSRRYVQRHEEGIKKYRIEWRKNNREKYNKKQNQTAHKRRAQKYENGSFRVSAADIKQIYSSPCIYCGSTERITMDHVIPISRGGTHGIGNLAPACVSCNSSKGNKFIMEWKNNGR